MKKEKRTLYYFSFRSPYSWIATRLLHERLSRAELERIQFVPFWEPDAETLAALRARGGDVLYHPMSRAKHLYILQDVKRLTRSLGYEHAWPIDKNPSWELPVLAYLAAERCGRAEPFRNAVYRARWQDGANIHTFEVLTALAAGCGVDPQLVREALACPSLRETALGILMRKWEDGVFGVPFFMHGHDKFWGVDRLGGFLAALRGQPYSFTLDGDGALPAHAVEASGNYDVDTAGGCG